MEKGPVSLNLVARVKVGKKLIYRSMFLSEHSLSISIRISSKFIHFPSQTNIPM